MIITYCHNCPIRQHTADGVNVGRCWHYLRSADGKGPGMNCPLHGDVTGAVKHYIETGGELTDDNRAERKPA